MDTPQVFPEHQSKERSVVKASFVISVRRVKNKLFMPEAGPASYLLVPHGEVPAPAHSIDPESFWAVVMAAAGSGVLTCVHGFTSGTEQLIQRHRKLENGLSHFGYKGIVVSFDWPNRNAPLNYLEDRHDAKLSALEFVSSVLFPLILRQAGTDEIPVHILAHSAGAYVVREAFDDADDHRELRRHNWLVSQMVFLAADVSRASLSLGNPTSSSLFRHSLRVTNYFNPFDTLLGISNIRRAGAAPRAGRHGLPEDAPPQAVNVNCSARFEAAENPGADLTRAHTFYFSDDVWLSDLVLTLGGAFPPAQLPTRQGAGSFLRTSL